MDCCCRPQEPLIDAQDRHMGTSTQNPKLKFSFRTQQASTPTRWTHPKTSTSFDGQMSGFLKDEKYGMGSTVASNNELIEMERQRQFLLQQDRNLDFFYLNAIIPLERQVQFYEHEVKIRSIQIMQLEDLLQARMQQRSFAPYDRPVYVNSPQQPAGNPVFLPFQPFQHFTTPNQTNLEQNMPIATPVTVRPKPFIQN